MYKKLVSMILAVLMVFAATAALAKTVEPDDPEIERFAGQTVNATIGEYNEILGAFKVTVYVPDRFDDDDVEALAAGDILRAGGQVYTVKEMTTAPDGEPMAKTDGGLEIIFDKDGDDFIARTSDDDRLFMTAAAVLYLKPAEGIVYEDDSDPDLEAEMKVYEGLEAVLGAKAEKEETSIGFDFYATTVTLNERLEIVKIHQGYDVAQ